MEPRKLDLTIKGREVWLSYIPTESHRNRPWFLADCPDYHGRDGSLNINDDGDWVDNGDGGEFRTAKEAIAFAQSLADKEPPSPWE